MIYCCAIYHSVENPIFLKPNEFFRDRKLEVITCPKCGALIAELTQFNIQKQEYERIRPKPKKTAKFLMQLEAANEIIHMPEIKYGTKSNMNWVYGMNTLTKDGEVRQYAKDFNGVKKLVKVIAGDKNNDKSI